MRHDLKCWSGPFAAVERGEKTHEVRVNDRNYQVGDILKLHEWNPHDPVRHTGGYTGKLLWVQVTYISEGGTFGLPANLCVMSIKRIKT